MKLYVTLTSPYARLARILVLEKGLGDRVEIVVARTRMQDSPYYRINPSGRVPYLVDDAGVGLEDSQAICAYLDSLDGEPRFHPVREDWDHRRIEARARSMCDGIAVWAREMGRPERERSPTTLAHEMARTERLADLFEGEVAHPILQGPPMMAHLVLAVTVEFVRKRGLGDLTAGRPRLGAWAAPISALQSMRATA